MKTLMTVAVLLLGSTRAPCFVSASDIGPSSPTLLWTVETGGSIRGGVALESGLDGGKALFGSSDGSMYAVDAKSGNVLWTFETGQAVSVRPAVADGVVYFASRTGMLYALSTATGDEHWVFRMDEDLPYEWGFDAYLSSPLLVDDLVYFGGGDGHVYALEADTGVERWRANLASRVRSSPILADGFIVVGAMDGVVHALNAETGAPEWTFETEGVRLDPAEFGFDRRAIVSTAACEDGILTIGGRDGFFYGLDVKDGSEIWRADHAMSWIVGRPVIRDGTVYTGTSDGSFVQALDLTSGEERWRRDTAGIVWSSGVIDEHHLYIGIGDGSVLALDRASGETVHRFYTGAGVFSSLALHDGVLFAGSDDGRMYALAGMTARGGGPALDRVVYWEDRPANKWFRNGGDEIIRDAFSAAGYEVVDGEGLARFVQRHLEDKRTSIAVFATNTAPVAVIGSDTTAPSLFRRYLDVGRAVWFGSTPLAWIQDPETGETIELDYAAAERIIDVKFGGPDVRGMGGFYHATPTEEGRRWGLTGWWVTRNGVSPSEVTTTLARDEYGQAVLWHKRYAGDEGTGLVQLWVDRDAPGPVKPLISVAEHGL